MVKKARRIITYIFAGIILILSAPFAVLAILNRGRFLDEGDQAMADFAVNVGIVLGIVALTAAAVILWTWRKGRKAQLASSTGKWASPLFEAWYAQEIADIERIHGKATIISLVCTVLMVLISFPAVILLIDTAIDIMSITSLVSSVGMIFFINYIADYERKYIKPLDTSIRKKLPDASAQEAFAKQMTGAVKLSYMPGSGGMLMSDVWVAPDYYYVRQPKASSIIKTAEIQKVVLGQFSYMVGLMGHVPHSRTCYGMEFFHSGEEKKPFWGVYYKREEDLHTALSKFQKMGLPEAKFQDQLSRA